MKHLMLLVVILAINIMGQSDVTKELLVGEWVLTTDVKIGNLMGTDIYGRDTIQYKIGLDPLDNFLYQTQSRISGYLYEPMALTILYPRGGTSEGYLFKVSQGFESYDADRMETSLNYKYFWLGKPDTLQISFKIPRNCPGNVFCSADTLVVTIKSNNKSETFGLKKRR